MRMNPNAWTRQAAEKFVNRRLRFEGARLSSRADHYLLTIYGTAGSRAPSKLQRRAGFSAKLERSLSHAILAGGSDCAFLAMRVFSANMGGKLVVALPFEISHHFIKGTALGIACRLEDPGACGAAKTSETAFFDPDELASRRHYGRKTKSRVRMFLIIFPLSPYGLQSHSCTQVALRVKSAQLAVSIRHWAQSTAGMYRLQRVPLEESEHIRRTIRAECCAIRA